MTGAGRALDDRWVGCVGNVVATRAVRDATWRRFPDGSVIRPSANAPKKLVAQCADGSMLTDEDGRMRYFDTIDEAEEALKAAGEGPGRG